MKQVNSVIGAYDFSVYEVARQIVANEEEIHADNLNLLSTFWGLEISANRYNGFRRLRDRAMTLSRLMRGCPVDEIFRRKEGIHG